MGSVMHSNAVFGSILRQHGFKRAIIPNDCPDCYTVRDFCYDHPSGIYVVGSDTHVVAVVDGAYIDTFDSGSLTPVYYWYKGD